MYKVNGNDKLVLLEQKYGFAIILVIKHRVVVIIESADLQNR